ncbi:MAG: CYTH domain-containing protein [Candidatus Diapherotrites archaeon]
MNEIELKFKLNSRKELNELEKKLKDLKAKKIGSFSESNHLFDSENKAVSKSDCVVRLRKMNKEIYLCFKGPLKSSIFKERTEIEFKVNSFVKLKKELNEMGLKEKFIYQKKKKVFKLKNAVLDLAELPVIGFWIEIEGEKKSITLIAEKLGFKMKDSIVKSFPKLFFEKAKRKKLKKKNMVF